MTINAVFIDLDDTIWNFTANSAVSLKHTFDTFKISRWCSCYDEFVEQYSFKNNEMWELYHYGKTDKATLGIERFKYPLLKQGCDLPDKELVELCLNMNQFYLEYLATLKELVPGAKDLLIYLKSKYKVGILSNGFKGIQQQKLKSAGVEEYIDLYVLSDEVGVTKPLKGIFDYALKCWNTTSENTVMIGDNYDADVCGAHNAGWKTIFFNRKGTEMENNVADYTVKTLKEIKQIL